MRSLNFYLFIYLFFFSAEEPGKCHGITVNIVQEQQQSEAKSTSYIFIPCIPEDDGLKRPRLQMRRTALFFCISDRQNLQKVARHWNYSSKQTGLVSLRVSRRISQSNIATRRRLSFITRGVKKKIQTHTHTRIRLKYTRHRKNRQSNLKFPQQWLTLSIPALFFHASEEDWGWKIL